MRRPRNPAFIATLALASYATVTAPTAAAAAAATGADPQHVPTLSVCQARLGSFERAKKPTSRAGQSMDVLGRKEFYIAELWSRAHIFFFLVCAAK